MAKKKTASVEVYDKVKWHWPDGKHCPSLAIGKRHIECAMGFLKKHKLLSEEGAADFRRGKVAADFALTSDTVTNDGDAFLRRYYGKWCKRVSYDVVPDDSFLLACFGKESKSAKRPTEIENQRSSARSTPPRPGSGSGR